MLQNVVRIEHGHSHCYCSTIFHWRCHLTLNFNRFLQGKIWRNPYWLVKSIFQNLQQEAQPNLTHVQRKSHVAKKGSEGIPRAIASQFSRLRGHASTVALLRARLKKSKHQPCPKTLSFSIYIYIYIFIYLGFPSMGLPRWFIRENHIKIDILFISVNPFLTKPRHIYIYICVCVSPLK